jgi:hypothetical protein
MFGGAHVRPSSAQSIGEPGPSATVARACMLINALHDRCNVRGCFTIVSPIHPVSRGRALGFKRSCGRSAPRGPPALPSIPMRVVTCQQIMPALHGQPRATPHLPAAHRSGTRTPSDTDNRPWRPRTSVQPTSSCVQALLALLLARACWVRPGIGRRGQYGNGHVQQRVRSMPGNACPNWLPQSSKPSHWAAIGYTPCGVSQPGKPPLRPACYVAPRSRAAAYAVPNAGSAHPSCPPDPCLSTAVHWIRLHLPGAAAGGLRADDGGRGRGHCRVGAPRPPPRAAARLRPRWHGRRAAVRWRAHTRG